MDYKEILHKSQLQESTNNIKLQEAKYCEAVLDMLSLMDEQEQITYISNMPAHLQEASLKRQASKMLNKIKELSPEVDNLYKVIKQDKYMSLDDKEEFLSKIDSIKSKINESLSIFNDPNFQEWYKKIDMNSGIFGTSKNAALPSRRSLNL